MKSIVLARIDDRLIHGQVVTAWTKFVGANTIIIVDNELSKNKLMQRIYIAAAPSGIDLRILTFEEALAYLKERDNQAKVMILAKNPHIFEDLINAGVAIESINFGGMGSTAKRTRLIRNAHADEEERACFKRLIDQGIPVYFQIVPDEKSTDVQRIL